MRLLDLYVSSEVIWSRSIEWRQIHVYFVPFPLAKAKATNKRYKSSYTRCRSIIVYARQDVRNAPS